MLLLDFNYEQGITSGRKDGLTWKGIIRSKRFKLYNFSYIRSIWILEEFLNKITYKLKSWFNVRPKR